MNESYSAPDTAGLHAPLAPAVVRELLGRIHPGTNGELLLAALLDERGGAAPDVGMPLDEGTTAPARELARVRRMLLAGDSAIAVQLAMSNTLTALQTEAQLLELEPLAEEHRRAVGRMVELTRRLASVMRRLEPTSRPVRA